MNGIIIFQANNICTYFRSYNNLYRVQTCETGNTNWINVNVLPNWTIHNTTQSQNRVFLEGLMHFASEIKKKTQRTGAQFALLFLRTAYKATSDGAIKTHFSVANNLPISSETLVENNGKLPSTSSTLVVQEPWNYIRRKQTGDRSFPRRYFPR